MPRVEFTEENIKKNDYDYPKFKLEKKGELARIAVLESPQVEFVHNLRKPKLVGGVAQKEFKTKRDGTQYEDYVYEFVARPICLGDYGTLVQDGSDPDRCPLCAEAQKSDKFYAPQRRFALHVVRYETKPNSSDVKEPFGASTQIYSFTDKVFNELFAFKKEGFDLRKHDIIVRAENPAFHGYNFQVAMKGEWLESEERKKYIGQLLQAENLAPDLSIFCGSKKSEKQIEYDIRAINEAWAIATGVQRVSAEDAAINAVGSTSLADGIDELLGSSAPTASAPATDSDGWAVEKPEPATSLDDLGLGGSSESAPAAASDGDDIDAILNGLK